MTAVSLRQAIVEGMGETPVTPARVIENLKERGLDLEAQVVMNELARLSREGRITRVRRGHYVAATEGAEALLARWRAEDLAAVRAAIDELLRLMGGNWESPPGYQSSALALVDAIFSARARYVAVKRVIERVKARSGRLDTAAFTIAELVAQLQPVMASASPTPSDDSALTEWFGNDQRSPGTNVPKARTVVLAAQALLEAGFDRRADFSDAAEVTDVLVGQRGIADTSIRYLLMLLGHDVVKPDVWVLRWLRSVLPDPARLSYDPRSAAELVEAAARLVVEEVGGVSVRDIDYLIWQTASGREQVPAPGVRPLEQRQTVSMTPDVPRLTVGTRVDWSPQRSRRARERWCGVVVDVAADEVLVRWEDTDARSGRGKKPVSLPVSECVARADLAVCDPAGALHPRLSTIAVGDVVDLARDVEASSRRHGEVVAFVGTPQVAVVNWTIVEHEGELTHVDQATPEVTVVPKEILEPCRGGPMHPGIDERSLHGVVYLELRSGGLELFRVSLGLLGSPEGNTGMVHSIDGSNGQPTGRSYPSLNVALHDYNADRALVYALNGADNAWCNFRCAGCHRFLEATHQWLYDNGPFPGLRRLRIPRLWSGFADARPPRWDVPPLLERENVGCWLGRPCEQLMGPF